MTQENKKYYLVSYQYVGSNQQDHLNDDYVAITTTPPRTNTSGVICIDGWCGTTNGWAVYGCGEYPSIEAATAEIKNIIGYGEFRERDNFEIYDHDHHDDVIATFAPGLYPRMTAEESRDYAYDMCNDITAQTTDAEIDEMMKTIPEATDDSDDIWYIDRDAIRNMFIERRDEERDELQEYMTSMLDQITAQTTDAEIDEIMSEVIEATDNSDNIYAIHEALVGRREELQDEEIEL